MYFWKGIIYITISDYSGQVVLPQWRNNCQGGYQEVNHVNYLNILYPAASNGGPIFQNSEWGHPGVGGGVTDLSGLTQRGSNLAFLYE